MKVKIEIDCDNAAFEDCRMCELGLVLDRCKAKLENMIDHTTVIEEPMTATVRDTNGNTVGTIRIIRG